MQAPWTLGLNALLGGLVITVGAWLAWDQVSLLASGVVFLGAVAFLIWRGTTIGLMWAWSTLLLGIESLTWPVITMVQIRSVTAQPSDQQMEGILSAVVMGLFSAVFWMALSYGLFRRTVVGTAASSDPRGTPEAMASPRSRRKR